MDRARRIIQIGRQAGEIADQEERRLYIARSVRQLVGSALVFVATDDDVFPGAPGHMVASAVDNFDARVRPAFDSMCERGSTFNPAITGMQAAVLATDIGQATVLSLDQLIEERTWRRCSFNQHFMRPAGIDQQLYAAIRVGDSICDELLLTGLSEKQIAAELELTPDSLHQYVKALYRTLGTSSRAELMARAIKYGEPT
jgi:hypothetical protein